MSDEQNLQLTTEQYLSSIIDVYNYQETFGLITLKSGITFRANSYFEYFREQWNNYHALLQLVEEEKKENRNNPRGKKTDEAQQELKEFFELTNGGILSNEEVEVNVQDISAMVAEYKAYQIQKEMEESSEDIYND